MTDGTPILMSDDMTEAELTDTAEVAREHAADARENARTADKRARLAAWHAENQRVGL